MSGKLIAVVEEEGEYIEYDEYEHGYFHNGSFFWEEEEEEEARWRWENRGEDD